MVSSSSPVEIRSTMSSDMSYKIAREGKEKTINESRGRPLISLTNMPDIYKYFGFVFFFHSNEHDPIHVHVQYDHKETILEIILENGQVKEIRSRQKKGVPPLSSQDEKIAREFVEQYAPNIVDKWVNYFVKKKRVVCTTIKKKLK